MRKCQNCSSKKVNNVYQIPASNGPRPILFPFIHNGFFFTLGRDNGDIGSPFSRGVNKTDSFIKMKPFKAFRSRSRECIEYRNRVRCGMNEIRKETRCAKILKKRIIYIAAG